MTRCFGIRAAKAIKSTPNCGKDGPIIFVKEDVNRGEHGQFHSEERSEGMQRLQSAAEVGESVRDLSEGNTGGDSGPRTLSALQAEVIAAGPKSLKSGGGQSDLWRKMEEALSPSRREPLSRLPRLYVQNAWILCFFAFHCAAGYMRRQGGGPCAELRISEEHGMLKPNVFSGIFVKEWLD